MEATDSIKLQSILMSNFRRFGEAVEIKFGAGATILVAPNGSGKTAVFEAIELALTSGVRRVNGRFGPLIRDGGERSSVRLNFGSWEREVAVSKAGVEILNEGRLNEIFKDVDAAQIPFLLRLTHLLDQRDSTWFCQQSSTEDAGGQLAMLPLGREASQVNAAVARVKPALSRKLTEVTGDISARRKRLGDWNALLEARNLARSDLSKPLVPLSTLTKNLAAIANIELPEAISTVAAVREQWAIANTLNAQRRSELQSALNNLAGVMLLPAAFLEITEVLQSTKQARDGYKATQSVHQAEIGILVEKAASAESRRSAVQAELAALKTKLQRIQAHSKSKALIADKEELHAANLLKGAILANVLETVQAEYNEALSSREVDSALGKIFEQLELRRHELAGASDAVEKWRQLAPERDELEPRIAELNLIVETLDREMRLAYAEVEKCDALRNIAKNTVSTYQDAAAAIREAVSIIAEKLPQGTEVCPVCMTSHGDGELRKRIATATGNMDPKLNTALHKLNKASEELELAKNSWNTKKDEMVSMQEKRAQLINRRTAIVSEILKVRSNRVLVDVDIDGASSRLDEMRDALSHEFAELDSKRLTVKPPLDVVAMSELAARFAAAKNDLDQNIKARSELEEVLSDFRKTLVVLEVSAEKKSSQAEIEQSISEQESKFEAIVREIEQINLRRSEVAKDLFEVDAHISRVSAQLELAEGRLQSQLSKWISSGLAAPPSEDELQRVKEDLLQQQELAEEVKGSLNIIETELSRIAEAQALATAQRAVDSARGNYLEDDYSKLLLEQISSSENELSRLSERKDALEAFHSHLTAGIAEVRGQIEAIVPHWQAILKRIVQEQRFSQTNLNYYKKNSKNHASIEVGLGDGQAAVADIASQAQMTDLQLSFLLSMANVHTWSPWKALLLDDPTQHHDLVHASSVFDVLRDFVSEHNFQVILTTHDAQQARFLMRKLGNDGVDARLWTLAPTQNGMSATQIA